MKFLSTPFRITKVEITGDLELLSLIGLVDASVYGIGVFLPERFGTTYRPLEMHSTPAKYFR